MVNKEEIFSTPLENNELAVAINVVSGEKKDRVITDIVEQLKKIADAVSSLKKMETSERARTHRWIVKKS